jgi:hypothetical protein
VSDFKNLAVENFLPKKTSPKAEEINGRRNNWRCLSDFSTKIISLFISIRKALTIVRRKWE